MPGKKKITTKPMPPLKHSEATYLDKRKKWRVIDVYDFADQIIQRIEQSLPGGPKKHFSDCFRNHLRDIIKKEFHKQDRDDWPLMDPVDVIEGFREAYNY